ncbi:hypothetical protein [Aeromonas dhakensis]|uniref:hypothetical protein n=1 Tax=Aeromonas dhakensis TaxID=196024 RepID=UPI003B9F188A
MKKLDALRAAKTKPELAHLLGVKPSSLTFLLYKLKPSTQYSSFDIPKKMVVAEQSTHHLKI